MAMELDPEFVADVKQRLRLVHRINNPMATFKMAEDALQVIEALQEREAADKARRNRSQKQSAD
jgi:hypothetical protein